MKLTRVLAVTAAALASTLATPGAASAAAIPTLNPSVRSDTFSVNGKTVSATTESGSIALSAGARSDFSAQAAAGKRYQWGASYTYTFERTDLWYEGASLAAANVYQGQRIVSVCFWWTQDERRSPTYCSRATYNKGWVAGKAVRATFDDTLNPVAPQSRFHYTTTRINPNITG